MLNEQVESVMAIAFELARIREEHGAQSGMYLSEVRALRAEVERLAAQAAPTADRWHDATLPPEIEQRLAPWLTNGAALHPATVNLVVRFARALSKKLAAAETKYGYSDGWLSPDWMDECRSKLMEHIAKGDPRDVAAYCAFLWHHGASTAVAQPSQAPVVQAGEYPPLPQGKAVIRCVADTDEGGWVVDFDCEGPLSHEPQEGDELFTADQMHAYLDADRASTVAALKARVAVLEKDAERYRQLRRGQKWSVVDGIGTVLRADELDAAIDAALTKGQPAPQPQQEQSK